MFLIRNSRGMFNVSQSINKSEREKQKSMEIIIIIL